MNVMKILIFSKIKINYYQIKLNKKRKIELKHKIDIFRNYKIK